MVSLKRFNEMHVLTFSVRGLTFVDRTLTNVKLSNNKMMLNMPVVPVAMS